MPGNTIQKEKSIHHLYHQQEAWIFFPFLLVNMKWVVQLIKTSLKNQCKNWMQSVSVEEQWIKEEANS